MSLRIVFMGTPEFAVPSLEILADNGFEIVGVITATDKLGGRGGKQLIESAVKKAAVARGFRVFQPEKLKNAAFLSELRALKADLQVVVAFRMLPEVVWNMPALGTINLHGSLLPKYRGAAPINWAVINGEAETGVTTFKLKHEIDTGDVLFQTKFPIAPTDNAGTVHDTMMLIGATTLLKTVQDIENQSIIPIPQSDALALPAPKIFFETCEIDFSKPTHEIYNFIRGLSPYPTAWTKMNDLTLKIFASSKEITPHTLAHGTMQTDGKKYLKFATADGFILVEDLQLEGKKRMLVEDFLRGYRF
jgi:methionyl-tRNA formyltransferase